MYVVGLTGGIASGKSTVASLFREQHHIDIIDADDISHTLTDTDPIVIDAITHHFGKALLTEDGKIDRTRLRKHVFEDDTKRQWLNALIHPRVRARMQEQIQQAKSPYCLCVIPLLSESSGINFLDTIIVVDTPDAKQCERLMERDTLTEAEACAIMRAQHTRTQRLAIADHILANDQDPTTLSRQVAHLHAQLLTDASQ